MLSILVIGLSFISVGIKNYSDSDEIAQMIEPSGIYQSYGYESIEEWKTSFENQNLIRIAIGVVIVGVFAGVIVFSKRKQQKTDE